MWELIPPVSSAAQSTTALQKAPLISVVIMLTIRATHTNTKADLDS